MKGRLLYSVVAFAVSALIVAGCMAAPSSAEAAYPMEKKAISLIIPWGAGGATDIAGRVVASALENILGVPVKVINVPGGASLVGLTKFVAAKPDGYTLAMTNQPATIITYADPKLQATYNRKSFVPVANFIKDIQSISVSAKGKYKTLQDLIDAAKAKPGGVKVTCSGHMSPGHMAGLLLEKAANVKFAILFYDNEGEQRAALLGGHIDAEINPVSQNKTGVASGDLRMLAVFDKAESLFLPGVKTAQAQGYDVLVAPMRGLSFPAGTPQEIVNIVSNAVKKAVESPEQRKKILSMSIEPAYMSAAEYAAFWDKQEPVVKMLIEETRK